MRKLLLSAALAAVCSVASAQKITLVPYSDNGYLTGTAISDNGRYVGGGDAGGQGFIYDLEKGQMKYFVSPLLGEDQESTADADIRTINNDGVGVGYIEETAAKFDFATGQYTKLMDEGSVAQFVSNDGQFICGFTYDAAYNKYPFYIKNGVKASLPLPTDSWIGFETNGYHVERANADGSLIVGYAADNFASNPLVLWSRNRGDSTYSVLPLCKRFFDGSMNLDGPQPYDVFEGASISANGKWLAINWHTKGDYNTGMSIARYNLENDSVEYITCPDMNDQFWYYANAISNDGTIIGYVEDQFSQSRKGMICQSGDSVAKYMADVYPTLTELATMDENGLEQPCAITPDGRYIAGFCYVEFAENQLCYATYVLDTKATATGVNSVAAAASNEVTASYGVDGKRLSKPAHRLVINRMANGSVKKAFVK